MLQAARQGSCAETYLRTSVPTAEDRAVAMLLLATMRFESVMPPEVTAAVGRWESLIAEELGDPQRAEVVRLVGDGLFSESLLTGSAPTQERVDGLVGLLLSPGHEGKR